MRTEDKVVVNSGVVCLPETADGLYNLVRVKDEARTDHRCCHCKFHSLWCNSVCVRVHTAKRHTLNTHTQTILSNFAFNSVFIFSLLGSKRKLWNRRRRNRWNWQPSEMNWVRDQSNHFNNTNVRLAFYFSHSDALSLDFNECIMLKAANAVLLIQQDH